MDSKGFLVTSDKKQCSGCGACFQACPKKAITMLRDDEGFSYQRINEELCVKCGLCHKVCQEEHDVPMNGNPLFVFGGYSLDLNTRQSSTSGGAFSELARILISDGYVIFRATSKRFYVSHVCVDSVDGLQLLRKSKYLQSDTRSTFKEVKTLLLDGRKVAYSGTPCQIAGLYSFLQEKPSNLMTIEVVCEGVPSPLYFERMDAYIRKRHGSPIAKIDFRNKDKPRWDFQVMQIVLENGKTIAKDRWFNPFWTIWLDHLMS